MDAHLKRNIAAQLAHGMFGQTSFRLLQAPTFLPAYLFSLSGSEFIVGLARSLQATGTVLSPVVGASLIGHRTHILGTTLTVGILMRVAILGMAVAGFLLATDALYALMSLMLVVGFFQGMSQVTMNSLRAKVIPTTRRGIVSGARSFLAGITSAAVSYFAGAYVLERNLFDNGYASILLLAFFIGVLGMAGLGLTKEPASMSVRTRETIRGTFSQLPGVLRENPAFARFFVARALAAFGRMAMPFYILFAATRMEITGATLGLLTTTWMLSSSVANLAWGLIADRAGYRLVLIITLSIWIASNIQLLFTARLSGMIVFFVMVGMAMGGFQQSSQNMVLELGRAEDIPLRLATSGSAVNLINAIGPLLGGIIVATASYPYLFITCIALQTIALLIVLFRVPEPRRN